MILYAVSLKLMREFEQGREVCDVLGDNSLAPGGAPYVVLSGHGGEEEARIAYREYAGPRPGKLYWRTLPELRGDEQGLGFYMRLVITRGGYDG